MQKRVHSIAFCLLASVVLYAHPIDSLLERMERGASSHFIIEQTEGDTDYYILSQRGDKIVLQGNNPISIAVGLNYYLEHYLHTQVSWDCMQVRFPSPLPKVSHPIYHTCSTHYRYYLNYCTFSYTMAYWDWERWQQEIDWMALHGVNIALAMTGSECVWRELLSQMGYGDGDIAQFISGPSYFAWWNMNNLEGWGGPLPPSWYGHQQHLQQQILERMRQLGIEPILPGYSGMVPSSAHQLLGVDSCPTGSWSGFQRPSFLSPTGEEFSSIAQRYYHIMDSLYGSANYYAIDPFHEGGDATSVDLSLAGKSIYDAMVKSHPDATWVIQAWNENPRAELISSIPSDHLLVLSLNADADPRTFDNDYIQCMLLNYGGNIGLFGRIDSLLSTYKKSRLDANCRGVGITSEGIENNEIMHRLLLDLPWCSQPFSLEKWLDDYLYARYGLRDKNAVKAWKRLLSTIYNCPSTSQQGPRESVFCARPSLTIKDVSAWASSVDYYDYKDISFAASHLQKAEKRIGKNPHFYYDYVDVNRQLNAERGRLLLDSINNAYTRGDSLEFRRTTQLFLQLIQAQDSLLSKHPLFTLSYHVQQAKNREKDRAEQQLYTLNLLTQITTWGPRFASESGRLHDYAHREWSGLLATLYYQRWQTYFSQLSLSLKGEDCTPIDFYQTDSMWCNSYIHSVVK